MDKQIEKNSNSNSGENQYNINIITGLITGGSIGLILSLFYEYNLYQLSLTSIRYIEGYMLYEFGGYIMPMITLGVGCGIVGGLISDGIFLKTKREKFIWVLPVGITTLISLPTLFCCSYILFFQQ